MEIFFESDKDQSGDGENKLYAFHPQRVETGWLYTPLRSWTAAKISDLCQNKQIQQCACERERDHGNANPVHVESIQGRGETCAYSQGGYSNQQTETAYRDEKRADTLKKRKEETGPAEQSRSFHCAGSNRFGDNVARRDSMNRSGQHGRAYSAKRNPALIPLIPSFYANSGKSPDPLGLLAHGGDAPLLLNGLVACRREFVTVLERQNPRPRMEPS